MYRAFISNQGAWASKEIYVFDSKLNRVEIYSISSITNKPNKERNTYPIKELGYDSIENAITILTNTGRISHEINYKYQLNKEKIAYMRECIEILRDEEFNKDDFEGTIKKFYSYDLKSKLEELGRYCESVEDAYYQVVSMCEEVRLIESKYKQK